MEVWGKVDGIAQQAPQVMYQQPQVVETFAAPQTFGTVTMGMPSQVVGAYGGGIATETIGAYGGGILGTQAVGAYGGGTLFSMGDTIVCMDHYIFMGNTWESVC